MATRASVKLYWSILMMLLIYCKIKYDGSQAVISLFPEWSLLCIALLGAKLMYSVNDNNKKKITAVIKT